MFHAKGLSPLGPFREILAGTEKSVVWPDLYRDAKLLGPGFQILEEPPFPRLRHHDSLAVMTSEGASGFGFQGTGIGGVVQFDVIDRNARIPQTPRKMAHGREYEGNLAFVMTDICRLAGNLRHEHDVAFRVEIGKTAQPVAQLIAQNKPKHWRFCVGEALAHWAFRKA